MSGELVELSNALADATQRAASWTVAVHTEARGSCSGVIWRPEVIVTAEHALRRDEEIHVTLPDGRAVAATLAGRDPSMDVAVLRCAGAAAPAVEFSALDSLKPGALALVVGRTRASGPVAAMGVISLVAAERRTWTGTVLRPYIRIDAGLQPTAVGGAVVDAQARVIGVATPRYARFGAVALSAAMVTGAADTLLEKGRIPRGYLGVGLQPVRLPESLRESLQRTERTAVIVIEAEPEGPAHKAGVLIGDILVSLGDKPVAHLEDVQEQIAGDMIGKPLAATIVRGGTVQQLTLVVGERVGGEK